MIFYVGFHNVNQIKNLDYCMISYNRIRNRRSLFQGSKQGWILDSGAFTEIFKYGNYREGPEVYANVINKVSVIENFHCAVSQDYMCEPFILDKTGLTIKQHQEMTIERYDAIRSIVASHIHIMPVLQGYSVEDYANHIQMYGDRLKPNMHIGLGSVCKRNKDPSQIEIILRKVLSIIPYVKLHGFGVKITALRNKYVWDSFYSTDSMAWSYAARMDGRDANSWLEAEKYALKINSLHHNT